MDKNTKLALGFLFKRYVGVLNLGRVYNRASGTWALIEDALVGSRIKTEDAFLNFSNGTVRCSSCDGMFAVGDALTACGEGPRGEISELFFSACPDCMRKHGLMRCKCGILTRDTRMHRYGRCFDCFITSEITKQLCTRWYKVTVVEGTEVDVFVMAQGETSAIREIESGKGIYGKTREHNTEKISGFDVCKVERSELP